MRRLILIATLAIILVAPAIRDTDEGFAKRYDRPTMGGTYVQVIEAAASTYNLPASLIAAIIKVESGFDPRAMSSRGAIGLMQLGFSTRKAMRVSNPFDPVQNILAGAKYFRSLLDRFEGDVEMAVAAYNAGPEAVERSGGVPPYSQTRQYVPKVMGYYTQYESGVAID